MKKNKASTQTNIVLAFSGAIAVAMTAGLYLRGNPDLDTPPTDIDSSIATCNIDEKNMILKIIDTQSGEMTHAQSILGYDTMESPVTKFNVSAHHRQAGTYYTIDLDNKTCTLDHGIEESVYQLVSP